MTPQKIKFINSLLQLLKIDAGEYTIEAIDKMTAHIKEHQYSDFIVEISKGVEFKRPLEIIKSVSDRYLDEIKSELFKDVEAEAKDIERKLERKFIMIEEWFSPTRGNKELIEKWKTPKSYIEAATIDKSQWSDKESYIIEKIGFSILYELYNNPYQHIHKVVEREMKSAITKKHLTFEKKQILNNSSNKAILELANKKQIRNKS